MEHQNLPTFKRGTRTHTKILFAMLLCIICMIIDARLHYLENLRQTLSLVVDPIQQFARTPILVVEEFSNFFVTQAQLKQENEKLRQEQLIMAAQLQRYDALVVENLQLRTLVQTQSKLSETSVLAEILHTGRDPFSQKVVVDKGSVHDVKAGVVVIDQKGLIGQVTRVNPYSSEITLLTDNDQIVPVEVVRNGLRAFISGTGDMTLDVLYTSVNADIQPNDMLVTSGIDGNYPKGIPVAKVLTVERQATSDFAKIRCMPIGGIGKYRHVLILTHPDPASKPNPNVDNAKALIHQNDLSPKIDKLKNSKIEDIKALKPVMASDKLKTKEKNKEANHSIDNKKEKPVNHNDTNANSKPNH